ncbi:zinc finger, c4 type (two domains) domain-containing protein [Ditylenchus destructor]|uniref:Zinc finger, c4 type (Two domains) domain-containing protein n=1 Tax=Ditylenchus destructor TaxID=166010 RepID=A0AAD4MPI3_9BILA|nr:zinc finger, c4 type (two domains) domain-containing protein [Ditylenchus destructor]
MRLKKADSDKCAICECASNAILHFGVNACRACAAFYRRSVVAKRTYRCRFGGGCSIGKDVRCICRACRLEKCRSMGMDLSKGQKYCGRVGPRGMESDDNCGSNFQEPIGSRNVSQTSAPLKINQSQITLPNGRFVHSYEPGSQSNDPGFNHGYCSASFMDPKNQLSLNSSLPEPCSSRTLAYWSSENATTSSQLDEQNRTQSTSDLDLAISSTWQSDFLASGHKQQISSQCTNPEPIPSQRFSLTILDPASRNLQQIRPTNPGQLPVISRMLRGYKKFLWYRKTGELVEGSFTDKFIALKADLLLISKMIDDHFPTMENFSTDSRWSLFWNFVCPFSLAECTYNSVRYFPEKNDTRFMVSARHYADLRQLPKYFYAKESKIDPHQMAEIFEPIYRNAFTMMNHLFRGMNFIEEELIGYMGLCFWNDTVDGLSDREIKMLKETQMTLHNELYLVCQRAVGGDMTQAGVRFAALCNMVPFAHKFFREVSARVYLVNVANQVEPDTTLRNPHGF